MDELTREPQEIILEYRPPEPREVVLRYARPLPEAMEDEAQAWWYHRRRRRRRGLVVFLLLLALAVAAALLAWFQPWKPSSAAPSAPAEKEISLPTYPAGEGTAFTVAEQGTEALTIQQVYQQVNPSVVTIMVQLGKPSEYTRLGVGTGVIFTADGYVITNYHVLEGGTECAVVLHSGVTMPAKFVAGDEINDLAVLKVEGENLPAAAFGDSNDLLVGDTVYAIGNPLGVELRGTLTDGIVSAINRDVWVGDKTMTLIQTNAALNSGNSGGPLINRFGQVVGINVVKMVGSLENRNVEGLGFAIPSASMERIIGDLVTFGALQPKVSLGLWVLQTSEVLPDGLEGIQVDGVNEGSCSYNAGIRVGDYILSAGGLDIRSSLDLLRARDRYYLGQDFPITLWREGETLDVTVTLTEELQE